MFHSICSHETLILSTIISMLFTQSTFQTAPTGLYQHFGTFTYHNEFSHLQHNHYTYLLKFHCNPPIKQVKFPNTLYTLLFSLLISFYINFQFLNCYIIFCIYNSYDRNRTTKKHIFKQLFDFQFHITIFHHVIITR